MNNNDILFKMEKNGITVVFSRAPAFKMVMVEIKGHHAFIQGIDLLNAVECIKTGNKAFIHDMWTCDGFVTLLMEFDLI